MELKTFKLGKGDPLLFLGGAFTTFKYYEKFLNLLAKEYRVYFFNYPGFGGSKPFKDGHTLENYVKAVEVYINDEKLKDFHLAGSSFGGFLAVHYTHVKRPKIKSLMLFSPLTQMRSRSLVRNTYRLAKENVKEKIKYKDRILVENAFNLRNFSDAREKLKHAVFIHKCSLDEKKVPEDIPTLLVIGEKDKLVDVENTIKVFKKSNVELVSYNDLGHEAFVVLGEEILNIIRGFTDRIDKEN